MEEGATSQGLWAAPQIRFSPVPADTPTLAQRDPHQTAGLQDCRISYIRVVKAPLSSVIWDSSDRTGAQECGRPGILAEAPTCLLCQHLPPCKGTPTRHSTPSGVEPPPGLARKEEGSRVGSEGQGRHQAKLLMFCFSWFYRVPLRPGSFSLGKLRLGDLSPSAQVPACPSPAPLSRKVHSPVSA